MHGSRNLSKPHDLSLVVNAGRELELPARPGQHERVQVPQSVGRVVGRSRRSSVKIIGIEIHDHSTGGVNSGCLGEKGVRGSLNYLTARLAQEGRSPDCPMEPTIVPDALMYERMNTDGV